MWNGVYLDDGAVLSRLANSLWLADGERWQYDTDTAAILAQRYYASVFKGKMGDPASDELLNEAGDVLLTGKQAMAFSRIRKIDSDHQRVGRQQAVLEAIFRRITQMDFLTLGRLALTNFEKVHTNLAAEQIGDLAAMALNLKNLSFESLKIPANGQYTSETRSGMAVLVPKLKKNRSLIESFLQEE